MRTILRGHQSCILAPLNERWPEIKKSMDKSLSAGHNLGLLEFVVLYLYREFLHESGASLRTRVSARFEARCNSGLTTTRGSYRNQSEMRCAKTCNLPESVVGDLNQARWCMRNITPRDLFEEVLIPKLSKVRFEP